MVDSENSPFNYNTFKISIGEIMKNPEILEFVLDHPKTKKIGINARVAVCNNVCS